MENRQTIIILVLISLLLSCVTQPIKISDTDKALFSEAIKKGDVETVKTYVNKGILLDELTGDGETYLFLAFKNNQKAVMDYLLEKGADINKANKDGSTLFLSATGWGNLEMTKYLISKGININVVNDTGMNALLGAISMGHTSIMEYLLQVGFDINSRDKYGVNSLQWSIMCTTPGLKRTVRTPDEEIDMIKKIIAQKVDLDNVGGGRTALHDAILANNLEIVKLLIIHGADSTIKHHGDVSTLQLAQEQGNDEIIKYIESIGIL